MEKVNQYLIKKEYVRRQKYKAYRKYPELWLRDVLGEDINTFKWSQLGDYSNHEWDGDKDPMHKAWKSIANKRWVSLQSATGCHRKGQGILMYDGSIKRVEDIQIGEQLMGDDSTPRNVLSLARGNEQMVKIIPHKGSPFVVNKSHILSLRLPIQGDVINLSVTDYLKLDDNDKIKKTFLLYRIYPEGKIEHTTFKVEMLGNEDYYGFELDKNHLYLLDDFTVTHNTGKTFMLARISLWFMDCFENSLVVTSAPTGKQLERNLWGEMSTLYEKMRVVRPYMRTTKLRVQAEGDNDQSPYKATHEIYGMTAGVSASEDSAVKAQGIHRKNLLIILEEAPGINDKIAAAFKNTAMNSDGDDEGMNVILAVGNPDHQLDLLNTLGELTTTDSYRVSAFDHPNVALGKNVIHGAVTRESIKRRAEEYGEKSGLYLSRVRGITPTESENTLIRGEWVDWADKYHDKFDPRNYYDITSYNALGIDVANSENGDMAAVVKGTGHVVDFLKEFPCPNASVLAQNLIYNDNELFEKGIDIYGLPTISDHNIWDQNIGVDAVGVGVSTVNKFSEHNYDVKALMGGAKPMEEAIPLDAEGKPMYVFLNLRTQMYWQLREDFRQRNIVLDIDDKALVKKLKKELTLIQFLLNDRAVSIEGKVHIKKRLGQSPNMTDALAYWNWMRNGFDAMYGGLSIA